MSFDIVSTKKQHKYEYDRQFVLKHTKSDYIRPTGSVFPDDINIKKYHDYEASNITSAEAENLYRNLLKSL